MVPLEYCGALKIYFFFLFRLVCLKSFAVVPNKMLLTSLIHFDLI